jgi:hypothetical protein
VIEHVDRAIERFFRTKVPLPESTAAISFETPDREWGSARTRPTVNVFLWEVVRSSKARRSGMEERVDANGARQRRPVTPIVDLHYLVTAWATEPRDEHQLLGTLLVCILAHSRLPDDVLSDSLEGMRLSIGLAPEELRAPPELWTSLQGGTRAALHLDVSLPIEVFRWQETAQPAEAIHGTVLHKDPSVAAASEEDDGEERSYVRRRANGALLLEGHRGPRPTPES